MEPTPAGESGPQKTLTPAEVHNVAFKKPPIGKRGYDEEEVDFFLDVVETELARLIEANEVLKNAAGGGLDPAQLQQVTDQALVQENQRLASVVENYEQQHSQVGEGDDGLRAALQQAEQRAQEAQSQAEQMHGQLAQSQQAVEEARAQAADAARQAQEALARAEGSAAPVDNAQQAVKILALAQQTADQLVSDAQSEADTHLREARATAAQVQEQSTADAQRRISEAQAHADDLRRDSEAQAAKRVQDAESHAASVSEALEIRKTALEQRLEELGIFEREYRSRLTSYLESQLRDLRRGDVDDSPVAAE